MNPNGPAASKFLHGTWTCYQLEGWRRPYSNLGSYCLLRFIKCFEDLSAYCSIDVAPRAFDDLLCSTITLDILPNARQTYENKHKVKLGNIPKAGKQDKPNKKKKKRNAKKSDEVDEEGSTSKLPAALEEEAGHASKDDMPLGLIKNFKRPIIFKVVLELYSEMLLVNRSMDGWLKGAIRRCIDCDRLRVVCVFKGDVRHLMQLRFQQGAEGNDVKSAQALFEHEWLEALQGRGRLGGHITPLGGVTRTLGAMPQNFPTVSSICVTAKNVSMPSVKSLGSTLPLETLQDCQRKLSSVRLSELTVTINSPSLLHLYYNASAEYFHCNGAKRRYLFDSGDTLTNEHMRWPPPVGYEASRGVEGAAAAHETATRTKTKKGKPMVEGVVKTAPVFIEKLRSGASLRPVLEYD